jgi:hypothetical protein|tara:strand:- start:9468 stop:9872 length:405 start_codon:yes stop_codon:yes gene_type:complete
MADAVNVTTIEDGERQLVVQLTNLSDSTGESDVTKIDVSALNSSATGQSCNEVRIQEIWAQVHGFDGVRLLYDADTNVVAFDAGVGWNYQDFSSVGGLKMYGTNATGDILLTTLGTEASGDSYEIVIRAVKYYA